mmetsp:Transcript_49320/g.159243  ORF Transcript_49320/g.159243 Transcript_49320/m.159243 type:complete len:120 (+) Transcript_49320:119-478(+)
MTPLALLHLNVMTRAADPVLELAALCKKASRMPLRSHFLAREVAPLPQSMMNMQKRSSSTVRDKLQMSLHRWKLSRRIVNWRLRRTVLQTMLGSRQPMKALAWIGFQRTRATPMRWESR